MNAREAEYAVRAALETLENADTEYSYWMKQYKHHVGDVSDWVNAASADEDDSAPRYRLLQQLLQDTRYGLECATRGVSEARQEVMSARQFYIRVAGLLPQESATGETSSVAESAEHAAPLMQGSTAMNHQRSSSLEENIQAEIGANVRRNWALPSLRSVPTVSVPISTALIAPASLPVSMAADNPKVTVVQGRANALVAPAQYSPPVSRVQQSRGSPPANTAAVVPTANNGHSGAEFPATAQGTTLSSLKRRRGRELEFLVPCKRKKYPKGFRWEDKTMHFFPKDMKIPICTLSTMWVYWLCGDAVANYPPYRILTPPDLESEAMRRLLSSLRFVMLEIETRILEKGAWTNYPTPKEAADMLGTVIESLSVRPNKTRQNLLPVGNLKWTSLGRIIRDQRKLLDEAESGGGSEDGEDN